MKKFISGILPIYAWIPTALCVVINMLSFYATRFFNGNLRHYDITTAFDAAIPFVPVFIVIYVLTFAQWFFAYIAVGRESKEFAYRILSAMIIMKIIVAVIFIVFPTTMTRAEISGTDPFSWGVSLIYHLDTPDNLFPSVHCAESLFFSIVLFKSEKLPCAIKWINAAFTLLVFASVVLVKQHVLLDIAGAVVLVPAVLLISHLVRSERMFAFLDKKEQANNKPLR